MNKVRSEDGTEIAYTRDGGGASVVLVGGGLDDGSENAALVPALAGRFTVINYARRGRGKRQRPAVRVGTRDRGSGQSRGGGRRASSPVRRVVRRCAGARGCRGWSAGRPDAACLGDGHPPVDRLITISQPTLVLTGPGEEAASQEMPVDYIGNSADAIVAAVPAAERRRLNEGSHMVDPQVLGPVLIDWFENASG